MNYEVFLNRIDFLCKKNNIKKTIAFENCGIGKDFSAHIKKGSSPSIEKVESLARYFDTSIDYLLGRTENPQSHKGVSDVSNKIAAKLSNLNDEAAKDVLKYINLMAASGHYNKTSAEDEKKKA